VYPDAFVPVADHDAVASPPAEKERDTEAGGDTLEVELLPVSKDVAAPRALHARTEA
jgi:hypothetical protein